MDTSHIQDRLEAVLADPVRALGLDLEAVEVSRAGKRRVVRVAVDKDGGITLDDIAEATRAVSAELDAADVLGEQPYTLEVSSPGVDRPLTLPRHWRRNTGRLVEVRLHEGEPITGRIRRAETESVELEVDGTVRQVRYADVRRAKVQIEFRRPEAAADHEE